MHYLNIALEKYNVLNFKVWQTNSKILEAYESSHYTIALSDLISNVFTKASHNLIPFCPSSQAPGNDLPHD